MLSFFGRVAGKIIAEFQYFYLCDQTYKDSTISNEISKVQVFLSIYGVSFRSTYTHHFQTSEALYVKLL